MLVAVLLLQSSEIHERNHVFVVGQALNEESQDNLVISPISLKIVLAMLYDGATGQTATEIQQALDFGGQAPTLRSKSRERFSSILKSLEVRHIFEGANIKVHRGKCRN